MNRSRSRSRRDEFLMEYGIELTHAYNDYIKTIKRKKSKIMKMEDIKLEAYFETIIDNTYFEPDLVEEVIDIIFKRSADDDHLTCLIDLAFEMEIRNGTEPHFLIEILEDLERRIAKL